MIGDQNHADLAALQVTNYDLEGVMARTLRSKFARAALWLRAKGLCQLCGERLRQDWHADHVVPWSKTKRTNVHEMQALCPRCNRTKGDREPMQYRTHQEKADAIGRRIVKGDWEKNYVSVDVVPGGGKTALAFILMNHLFDAGLIDNVVWLAPAKALCFQVAKASRESAWCNRDGYVLHPSKNESPLFPADTVGCVSTYQGAASILFADLFKRRRCLLIADEIQYLAEDENASWARTTGQLRELAAFFLPMSGTLWRHDGKPIPFIEYGAASSSGERFPVVDIRYSLAEAIADGAVRPPQFFNADADVSWKEDGRPVEDVLSESDSSKALRTFLSKGWKDLLAEAVKDWRAYRESVHPSRLFVIAKDRESARGIHSELVRMGVNAVYALGDELKESHATLRDFRDKGIGEALVSVEMVSCGYDVPDLTHLVFLARHRSLPKSIQAFGRVWRMMRGIEADQSAWIYAPDDIKMAAIRRWVCEQRDIGVKEKRRRESDGGDGPEPEVWWPESATIRSSGFTSASGETPEDIAHSMQNVRSRVPRARALAVADLEQIVRAARDDAPKTKPPQSHDAEPTHEDLRVEVNDLSRKHDRLMMVLGRLGWKGQPWKFGYTNGEMGKDWIQGATVQQLKNRRDELVERIKVAQSGAA